MSCHVMLCHVTAVPQPVCFLVPSHTPSVCVCLSATHPCRTEGLQVVLEKSKKRCELVRFATHASVVGCTELVFGRRRVRVPHRHTDRTEASPQVHTCTPPRSFPSISCHDRTVCRRGDRCSASYQTGSAMLCLRADKLW
jgi:hypothetical protein